MSAAAKASAPRHSAEEVDHGTRPEEGRVALVDDAFDEVRQAVADEEAGEEAQ
jgi:hypothetical protein